MISKQIETFLRVRASRRAFRRVEIAREYRRGWDDALQETAEQLVEEGGSRSFPFVWKDAMLDKLARLIK